MPTAGPGRLSTMTSPLRSTMVPRGATTLTELQAVVVGLRDELLAAQDLQEPEAEEDDAEQHRGDAEDDGHAQGDGRQLDDGLVAAAGADGPVAARRVSTEQRHADHLALCSHTRTSR